MSASVAVITPTRNREPLLRETLDSVAAQTLGEWEHIVVDDGSDDGTAAMMAARCAADPRVRYIVREGERAGANVCRNIGIRAASAPFVVMLDSDDLLAPECLARRTEVLARNLDFDFVTFRCDLFERAPGDMPGQSANPDLLGDDLCQFLYFETPWQTTAPIWRRETLLRLGLFDETLLSWQDIELHVRAICADCRYLRFADVDYHFRYVVDPTKVSFAQRKSPAHLAGALSVIERLEAHVRAGPGMDLQRARALCSLYFFVAERWIDQGSLLDALRAWRRSADRGLGPIGLYAGGALLLAMARARLPVARLTHKWKGWSRLRTNPEIVPA